MVFVFVTPATASADGIDVVWFITRVGSSSIHPVLSAAIVVGLMLLNYLLNLVVIGMPATRALQVKFGALSKDLAVYTLLAQIADRVCAVGGLALSFLIVALMGPEGEQGLKVGFLLGVALNFVFSALAVGSLALWYLRRRWRVEGSAMVIAMRAAVITNPAWAMIPWFISR
ncbi:MAG: hypothetical protein WAV20_02050 [Blastocatellia bacterium]